MAVILLFLVFLMSGCGSQIPQVEVDTTQVEIDSTSAGLIIYYSQTDSIGLRCFTRPDPSVDSSIVFCCAAAFTLDYKREPDHQRICSAHVSDGEFYAKPRIRRNTGAFVAYGGTWRFLYQADADPAAFEAAFLEAAAYNGAGFAQEMMIHNGEKVKTTRPYANVNLFRALCEKDGRLCIADATKYDSFGNFIQCLVDAGVTEALYTDMGDGWNYSWYRENAGEDAVFIHPAYKEAATNWIVFYESF